MKEQNKQLFFPTSTFLVCKVEIAEFLYLQNRKALLSRFIAKSLFQCEFLEDHFYSRKLKAISARVEFKANHVTQAKELFKESISIGQTHSHQDEDFAVLLTDYSELLCLEAQFKRGEGFLKQALLILERNREMVNDYRLHEINSLGEVQCFKEQSENKFQINQFLEMRPTERLIRKNAKKQEVLDEKIKLRPFKQPHFFSVTRSSEITPLNPQQLQHVSSACFVSVYKPSMELVCKIKLRLVWVLLLQFEKKDFTLKNGEKVLELGLRHCREVHHIYRKNYFINNVLKSQCEYLQGLIFKYKAELKLRRKQEWILKNQARFDADQVDRIRDHLEKSDLCTNALLQRIPGLSKFLEKELHPLLIKAKDKLLAALTHLNSESPYQEFCFDTQKILFCIIEINLLLSEYFQAVDYKYLSFDNIRQIGLQRKIYLHDKDIKDTIEQERRNKQNTVTYQLWEAMEYAKKALLLEQHRVNLREKFNFVPEEINFGEENVYTRDVFKELLESEIKSSGEKDLQFIHKGRVHKARRTSRGR